MSTSSGEPDNGASPRGNDDDAADLERTQRLSAPAPGAPEPLAADDPPTDDPAGTSTPTDDLSSGDVPSDDVPSDDVPSGGAVTGDDSGGTGRGHAEQATVEISRSDLAAGASAAGPGSAPPADDDGGPDVVPATERIEFPIDLSTPPEGVDEGRDRPGRTDRIRYQPGRDAERPGPTDRIHYRPGAPDTDVPDDDDEDEDTGGPRRPVGWAPAPEGFAPGTIGSPGSGRPSSRPPNVDWGPSPGAPAVGGPPVVVPGVPVAGPAAGGPPAASGGAAPGTPVIGGPSYQTTVEHQTIEQQNIAQQFVQGSGGPGGGPGGQPGDDEAEHVTGDDVVSEVPAPVQTRPARTEDLRRPQQEEGPQGPGRLSDRLGQPARPGRERERVVGDTPALRGLPGGPGLRVDRPAARGNTPADRHTPGMMHPSVWQRISLVWREAGAEWERAGRDGQQEWQPSGDAFLPGRAKRGGPLPGVPRPLLVTLGAVAAVVVVIAAVSIFGGGSGGAAPDGRIGGAAPADDVFAMPAGAKADGVDQGIGAIARYGSRIVISGREKGGTFDRPQFFTSSDGGTTWTTGTVRGPNGGAVPPGGAPTRIVGGASGWVALNLTNVPVWTSKDGGTWTQLPDNQVASAFHSGDSVATMVAKTSGFLAVGTHTSGGKTTPVVWNSDDGTTWNRTDRASLDVPDGKALKLSGLATRGDVVVAGGSVQKTVTKKVTVKKGKKKKKKTKKTTVHSDGFWRSTDGGGTWEAVTVPRAAGASGEFVSLTATKDAFYVVRPGSGGRNAVVMSSSDGKSWKHSGSINGGKGDKLTVKTATGADDGLAALGTTANGHSVVYHSTDGKSFKRLGDLGSNDDRTIRGVMPTASGAVTVGSAKGSDEDAYLAVTNGSGKVSAVDLTKVPGAAHPDHALSDVRNAGGRYVAVGGANGDAAAWISADGRSWRPAQPSGDAFARSGAQRLTSVTHGSAGWLTVGRAGGGHPLVASSPDGARWTAVDGDKVFSGSDTSANAAAAGGSGYVVVGSSGGDAMAWTSKDLKSWTEGDGEGLSAPKKTSMTMNDVAAGSSGYVAVGSVDGDDASEPAAWISPDGAKWTRVEMDAPQSADSATLTRVAVNGNRLVAGGVAATGQRSAPFTMTSVDGGRSWQPAQPPGAATAEADLTDVTPMGKGFAVLATQGAPGASHVRLWTSTDGTKWRARQLKGAPLVGPGNERINAAVVSGGSVLGVGSMADAKAEHVTLWRAPLK